jgi:tetratricopeptide (TPR) repeat protein
MDLLSVTKAYKTKFGEIMTTTYNAQLLHAQRFLNVLGDINVLYNKGGVNREKAIEQLGQKWLQIQHAQAWANTTAPSDSTAAYLCWSYPLAGEDVLPLLLSLEERTTWLESALYQAHKAEQTSDITARLLYHLGKIARLKGNFEKAKDYFLEAFRVVQHSSQSDTYTLILLELFIVKTNQL